MALRPLGRVLSALNMDADCIRALGGALYEEIRKWGSQRWELCSPHAANAPKGMSMQAAPRGFPVFDEVLTAGDFLFVPGEYWCRCENGLERSLCLCIAFEPPCGQDMVTSLGS